MWNHCSPVFHFNWLYSVPRPLSNNLPLNFRYRQQTSRTYWTFALHRLTFSTTANTTSSCMEQPWGHLFLLLSPKLWCNTLRNAPLQLAVKRYRFGYDTLATLLPPFTKTKLTLFTTTLTNRTPTSSLPIKEIEENGKLPFLDCLVSRDNNELRTTVYRKPTYTDRLLDESSYNPTSHKATTIKTLTRRAQLVCDTPDSLRDESKYLERVFHKNNYNADFIRRNIYRPTEADATNRNPTPVTTVTIPYIKGTSETISRILQPYNIRVAHKPTTTLRHLLTNVKDRDEPNNRQGTVYKIKCSDCQASYLGETGRNLNTRLTEHKRAVTMYIINWQTTTLTGTVLNA